jgi:hypothetical protein
VNRRLIPLLLALLFASGCSLKTMALRQTAALMDQGSKTFFDEPDPELAREGLGAQLKLLEGLLENEPKNARLLRLNAQGFASYAFLFLEETEPERAQGFYQRARDYGLRALGISRDRALEGLEADLPKLGKDKAPALFWAAQGWAGWVNLSRDNPSAVAELPKAVALMERARQLSPEYNFAGPDLFFGSYFASRPKILGGDPAKAKAHFDAARKLNDGKCLMADYLEAKYYSTAVLDQELFTKLLSGIAEAPAGRLPLSRLSDEVAKQKAKKLLEKANDLF